MESSNSKEIQSVIKVGNTSDNMIFEFCRHVYLAAISFGDHLNIGVRLKTVSINNPGTQHSEYQESPKSDRAMSDWYTIANNKIAEKDNSLNLELEDGVLSIYEIDQAFTKTVYLCDRNKNKSLKFLTEKVVFSVNFIDFSLDEMMDYVMAYQAGTSRPDIFMPKFNQAVVITDYNEDSSASIKQLHGIVSAETELAPTDPALPPNVVDFAAGFQEEILEYANVSPAFIKMTGTFMLEKDAVIIFSDKRLLKSNWEHISSELSELVKIEWFDIKETASEHDHIYENTKDTFKKLSEEIGIAFKGDISDDVKDALNKLENALKRY